MAENNDAMIRELKEALYHNNKEKYEEIKERYWATELWEINFNEK